MLRPVQWRWSTEAAGAEHATPSVRQMQFVVSFEKKWQDLGSLVFEQEEGAVVGLRMTNGRVRSLWFGRLPAGLLAAAGAPPRTRAAL